MRDMSYRNHVALLMKRHRMLCGICGKKISDYYHVTIDHIKPLSLGGKNDLTNLQLAHKKCNEMKNEKEYLRRPKKRKIFLGRPRRKAVNA